MAQYRIKIYQGQLNLEMDKAIAGSPEVKRVAYNYAASRFERVKQAMLKEFDEHPVTNELAKGGGSTNDSGTLGGYGNLFAFIGFDQGAKPTQSLRNLLSLGTRITQTIYRQRHYYFVVDVPTRSAMEKETPMPWEPGNSWLFGIEETKGISGLSHFMYKRWLGSRRKGAPGGSTWGFQLKEYPNMEGATFTPHAYVKKILSNLRDKVNNIK
jgi:hypothetical protein